MQIQEQIQRKTEKNNQNKIVMLSGSYGPHDILTTLILLELYNKTIE